MLLLLVLHLYVLLDGITVNITFVCITALLVLYHMAFVCRWQKKSGFLMVTKLLCREYSTYIIIVLIIVLY